MYTAIHKLKFEAGLNPDDRDKSSEESQIPYKGRFKAGFHLGAYGIGTESTRITIPSDTLFSALLTAWVRLGGDPACWAEAFPRTREGTTEHADPPFLLTSTFPYAGGTLLFPKPLGLPLPGVPKDDRKGWKRVRFVSERIFFRIMTGKNLDGIWPSSDADKEERLKQGGSVLVLADEAGSVPDTIWKEEKVPRVSLDRISSSSNLYSVGRVSFAQRAGLWFGVRWSDPDRPCGDIAFSQAFEHALKELEVSGLGGDRSTGQGVFEEELMDELSWPDPLSGEPAVLLSRYHPRGDELPAVVRTARAYSLESVGGWGASPSGQFRRRTLTFLAEGSTIVAADGAVMGDLVDVSPSFRKPGHPVWRYGLAFTVPLGGGG